MRQDEDINAVRVAVGTSVGCIVAHVVFAMICIRVALFRSGVQPWIGDMHVCPRGRTARSEERGWSVLAIHTF